MFFIKKKINKKNKAFLKLITDITYTVYCWQGRYLILNFADCSTVTCDSGYDVCLSFNTNIWTSNVFVIKRNNINTCLTIRYTTPILFETSWRNQTFNCSVTSKTISLCFGDCQTEDAGNFTLHFSATNESPFVENIELKVTGTPI